MGGRRSKCFGVGVYKFQASGFSDHSGVPTNPG